MPGQVTFFELAALVRSLRELVLKSNAVGPADMAVPLEAKSGEDVWDDAELSARIQTAITGLTQRRDALVLLEADTSDLDDYAKLVSSELLRTAFYGAPQTGTGQIHADIRGIYDAIAAKIKAVVTRWTQNSSDYATLMATWPALTTDPARFQMLQQAERLISSSTTAALPADPNVYKAALEALKVQFDAHLGQFRALLVWGGGKLVDFAAAADAMRTVAAVHDVTPFGIEDQKTAITVLRTTIVTRVTALADDLTQRISDASAGISSVSGNMSSKARVQQLLDAAKSVLGSEFKLVPRFQWQPIGRPSLITVGMARALC